MKELCGLLLILTVSEVQGRVLHRAPKDIPTCINGNTTYKAGATFKTNACMTCHCPRRGGPVQCAIEDCLYEKNCVRYEKHEGACCHRCLERGCHHGGTFYRRKDKWDVHTDPRKCKTVRCECKRGGSIQCSLIHECKKSQSSNQIKQKIPRCILHGKFIPGHKVVRKGKCVECRCPKHANAKKRSRAICRYICG